MSAPEYVPVDGRPLRVAMGTRPLDLDEWIEIDGERPAELAEKDLLLEQQRAQVLATTDAGRAGAQETWELLVDFLPRRFPQAYSREGDGLRDHQLDRVVAAGSDPLEAAARLVQEDLAVMTSPEQGRWLLSAACLCFPSRWSLLDKIGRDMAQIHLPVPFYAERVGAPADSFLDRLDPGRPVWRTNWTILDGPELFQPASPGAWRGVADGIDLGDALYFRVERQTLRRLPASGAVLFTIRTYVRSLASLASVRPGIYGDLASTLRQTPAETVDYKGWTPLMGPLLDWLSLRA